MSLDQDIDQFSEYNVNIETINSRVNLFANLTENQVNASNYVAVRRSGLWSVEGITAYNGVYQDFGNISGSVVLELNNHSSLSGIMFTAVGETLIDGFGDNFITGHIYTFFIKQDSVGGRKVRWPIMASVLGSVNEDPNSITVSMFAKLPDGKMFVKNNAYLPNTNIGFYEFRVVDDNVTTSKGSVSVVGNVFDNDWGSGASVVAVDGDPFKVGVSFSGSTGGTFTINSNGSWTFVLGGDFEYLSGSEFLTSTTTYTASNGLESLTANLSVTVSGQWLPSDGEIVITQWLDADDASTLTAPSGVISAWNDKSGNGLHITQATESAKPIVSPAFLDGKNVVTFSGSTKNLLGTSRSEINRYWFYVVQGTQNIKACGESLSGTCIGSSNFGAITPASWSDGGAETIGMNGLAAYQHKNNNISNILYRTATISGFNVVMFRWENRRPTVYLNGVLFKQGLTANQAVRAYLSMGTGTYGYFNGHVAERLHIEGDLTQDLIDKIVGYLSHKWGLTDKLQYNHPYKYVTPGSLIFEVNDDLAFSPLTSSLSGNVLLNDKSAASVTKVDTEAAKVGTSVAGTSGGLFTINGDGSWAFNTNSDFDSLSGIQFLDTSVGYSAANGVEEKSALLTVRVQANYYSELDYDGGGWTLLTDEHIIDGVPTYSYDPATREFSMRAETTSTSASHFGSSILLKLAKGFSEVRVFHSGGSGYSCASVTWNNLIYGGNEDLVPNKTIAYYPGWYVLGYDIIQNTVLVDGWNTRTLLCPGTRISLGLGGYSGCTRVTMKNIVLVR